MDTVAVDIVGPVPTSECGNRYIIVFVDVFIRFTEAIPMPKVTAEVIAVTLFEYIICRYGCVKNLFSIRGSTLTAKLMSEACHILQIKRKTTKSYRLTSNGLCERMNGTITNAIATLSNGDNTAWDLYITAVLYGYRTAVHRITGETPSFLLYGYDPRTPEAWDVQNFNEDMDTHRYRLKLINRLRVARETARKTSSKYVKYENKYLLNS